MANKDLTWEDLEQMTEQELWLLMDDIKIVLGFKHGVIA